MLRLKTLCVSESTKQEAFNGWESLVASFGCQFVAETIKAGPTEKCGKPAPLLHLKLKLPPCFTSGSFKSLQQMQDLSVL